MARRDLSPDEKTLWQSFTKGILPLRARRATKSDSKSHLEQVPASGAASSSTIAAENSGKVVLRLREVHLAAPVARKVEPVLDRLKIDTRQAGLDTTSWNALASGKMRAQKRLDLHGHFAQDAFYKLHYFLHASSAQGIRCVEVITGLGSGQEGGVIRQELPHWLERGDLRPLILAVVHTHKRNRGAVRILLRARTRR